MALFRRPMSKTSLEHGQFGRHQAVHVAGDQTEVDPVNQGSAAVMTSAAVTLSLESTFAVTGRIWNTGFTWYCSSLPISHRYEMLVGSAAGAADAAAAAAAEQQQLQERRQQQLQQQSVFPIFNSATPPEVGERR